jgi:hypothetical protein
VMSNSAGSTCRWRYPRSLRSCVHHTFQGWNASVLHWSSGSDRSRPHRVRGHCVQANYQVREAASRGAAPALSGNRTRPDLDTLLTEVRNLHRALLTRGTIDQSKGVLMVVYGLDSEAAFAMLVWHSGNGRLPLRELATRFLKAVRNEKPGTLTIGRTDALLAGLAG